MAIGRPTALTPDVHDSIIGSLAIGSTAKIAAARAGISDHAYHNWMRRGGEEQDRLDRGLRPREKEALFVQFFNDATHARAQGKAALLAQIHDQAKDDWRAAAWLLARLEPDDFGDSVKVSGPIKTIVEVKYVDHPPEDSTDAPNDR